MKEQFYVDNILNSFEFIYECGKKGNKVQLSAISNAPRGNLRLKVHYRNGVVNGFQTWVQFVSVLYELGEKGSELNFNKIKESFSLAAPNHLDKKVVVKYYGSPVQQEDGVVMGAKLTYSDCVKAKTDLNAEQFKEWLTTKVKECNIDYEVDMTVGVNKHMKKIKEVLRGE